eukprot:215692_1
MGCCWSGQVHQPLALFNDNELLSDILQNDSPNCTNIKTCNSITLIASLLCTYESSADDFISQLMQIEAKHKSFILNHYHHILFQHLEHKDVDVVINNFGFIYKKTRSYETLILPCEPRTCAKYKRHTNGIDDVDEVEQKYVDSQYYIHLLDMIHCNILHSYDTGMRQKPRNMRIPETIQPSIRWQSRKYFTNINRIGHFGHKYYYWNFYRDNEYLDCGPNEGYRKCDFYVEQKYDNIKQETLENIIYRLKNVVFETALEKAKQYAKSSMAKRMKSHGVELSEFMEITPGTILQEENILVIVLYSDYYELCSNMRSTFMMSENETLIGLKARNSEYSNMSRLLFETVELYGTSVYNSKVNVFYHNISHHIFAAFVLYLSAPTSTTATFQVTKTLLHNSNISDGLILELVKQNNYSSIKCFDVRWISSHNNEDERLFIGSNRPLQIRSICSPVIRLLSGDDHKFTKESIDSPTPDGKTYHLTNLPNPPLPLKKEPKANIPYSMKQMKQLSMESLSDVIYVEMEQLLEEIPSYVDENENKIVEDAKIQDNQQAIEIVTTPVSPSARNLFKPPLINNNISDNISNKHSKVKWIGLFDKNPSSDNKYNLNIMSNFDDEK